MNREPALIIALLQAVIVLAVSFGLELTDEQSAAIMAVVIAAGAVFTRSKVTPTAKVYATRD